MKTKLLYSLAFLFYFIVGEHAFAQTRISATIAKADKEEIAKEDLLAVSKLSLLGDVKSEYKIKHFAFMICCKDMDCWLGHSYSDQLTDSMIMFINKPQKGCTVYFRNIECVNSKNEVLKLPPLAFIVK